MNGNTQQHELRLRSDLQWCAHADHKWVVRDPVTSRFFRLNSLEKAAAHLMDGVRTPAHILTEICQHFPGRQVDQAWLLALATRLRQHHLLVSTSDADARRLARARQSALRQSTVQSLLSPLAIRIPLFDPSAVLKWLRVPAQILFHRMMVAFWLFFGLILMVLVAGKLLSVGQFSLANELSAMRGDRWLVMLVAYLIAKSIHELGHALACVRNDAKCNEIGLLLLCLAPCMYCDTTDSWKLPSKWQRAGIAVAGMYFELILATIAALVWLTTVDGTLHFLAASMMIVCSVGTIFVNANPLLKYDGYYILSDIWNVPNLSDQSREAMQTVLRGIVTGKWQSARTVDASIAGLVLYGIASAAYRWLVLGLILWICWTSLVPIGLGFLAIAVTFAVMLGMVMTQMRSLKNLWTETVAMGGVRFLRVLMGSTLLIVLMVIVLTTPIPSFVRARAVSDFAEKTPLFASQSAELASIVSSGAEVLPGSEVLRLESLQSQVELIELEGEIRLISEKLRQLRQSQTTMPEASYQIPILTQQLAELRQRIDVLQNEIAGLRYVAPKKGFFLPGNSVVPVATTSPKSERFPSGVPDATNLGCVCDRGTLIGWFVLNRRIEVTALVNERDVRLLQVGMPALVQWDAELGRVAKGTVTRISPDATSSTPAALVGDPMLVSNRNREGEFEPESPHFEVAIDVDQPGLVLRGAPATIQIPTASESLLDRALDLWRDNLKPIY